MRNVCFLLNHAGVVNHEKPVVNTGITWSMDGDTLRFFRLNGTPTFSREKVGVPFNTAQLPPIEYAPGDIVRRVRQQGFFSYRGRIFRISKAFTGYPVGLRPTVNDALMDVFSCHQKITQIDVAVV